MSKSTLYITTVYDRVMVSIDTSEGRSGWCFDTKCGHWRRLLRKCENPGPDCNDSVLDTSLGLVIRPAITYPYLPFKEDVDEGEE